MAYKVKVQNTCSCFLKSGLADVLEFDSRDEAKTEAETMINKMRTGFCQKHEFDMKELAGDFTIFIKPRS